MSIENNQRRTIDGLNTLFCDTINVVESIELNGDNGNPNQIIRSDGTNSIWASISDLLASLSLSSPLSYTSGSTYNGETARVLQISNIPNATLQNSTISGKALGTNLDTITFTAPLTATTYKGDTTPTITIADGDIGNAKLANSTISGKALGTDLSSVGLYFGLEFVDGSTGYNGTTTRTINTKFKSGGGISADSGGLFLTANTISGIALGSNLNNLTAGDGLELDSGSTYNGATARTIKISPLYQTISDRISYEDTGVGADRWLYTITATEWRPNDDSTLYNIHIEDDSSTTLGRAKVATSSLEAIAIIHIPFDWTPSKIFIDCRNSAGSNQTRTYYLYKVRNWGGTGNTYLGSYSTNTETTLEYNTGVVTNTYGAGTSGHSLMIRMVLSSTSDHLGGGYITLSPPS